MARSSTLTDSVRQLLAESFEGAAAGTTWFVDDRGILASIEDLDADRASQAPSPEGSSIAAHVEHVRWFLAMLNAYARGEQPDVEWSKSWTVQRVDARAWGALQSEVEREYRNLHEHLATGLDETGAERLMPVLATVAHAAYHLGAIRQMIKAV